MNKPKYTSRQLRAILIKLWQLKKLKNKIQWRRTLNSAEKITARRTRRNPKTYNKKKKKKHAGKNSANIGTRNANVIST